MPMSLKCMIDKWLHKGQISQEEYNAVIKKLEGHDKQIRAEVLDELFNTETRSEMTLKEIYEEVPINEFDEGWNRCYEDFEEVAEQLKGAGAERERE